MLTSVLGLIIVIWAAITIGRLVMRVDEKVEDRRRAMAQLANHLSQYGLVRLPEILIDYSVGDYSGMLDHVRDFVRLLTSGSGAVIAEFDVVFERVLAEKLETEAGRTWLEAKVDEAIAAYQK